MWFGVVQQSRVRAGVQRDRYNEYVTIPSNPINYTAPAPSARVTAITTSEQTDDAQAPFTVGSESFGLASQEEGVADPDFVAVYADSGDLGYVRSARLNSAEKGTSVTVYERDGQAQVGGFTIK